MSSICLLIMLSERGTLATSQTGSELIISFIMTLQTSKINDSATVCGILDLATSSAT